MKLSRALQPGAPLMLVGEAYAQTEAVLDIPFSGPYGREIFKWLELLGVPKTSVSLSNVFNEYPPGGNIEALSKDPERLEAARERLRVEIATATPNIVVAMGNLALQQLTGLSGIKSHRGHVILSSLLPVKVIPTLLTWFQSPKDRANIRVDLMKAVTESAFSDIRYTRKECWIEPSIPDLLSFEPHILSAPILAVDIETDRRGTQITCLGFATSENLAICIPFCHYGTDSGSYWSRIDEIEVWKIVQRWLALPTPKLFHNGQYDLHWLNLYGINVRGPLEDTMLLHHSKFSELEKGLENLAAVYARTPAWKTTRPRGSDESKREG